MKRPSINRRGGGKSVIWIRGWRHRRAGAALMLTLALLAAVSPASIFAATGSAALEAYAGAGNDPATKPADPTGAASVYGNPDQLLSGITTTGAAAQLSIAPSAPVTAVADTTAPSITGYAPANNTVTGTTVSFSADYADPAPSSGINTGTAMLHIDNRHQFGCAISDSRISLTKAGLAAGSHKIEAFICDANFNCANTTWYITVDAAAPAFTDARPTGTINMADTTISATFNDGSGAGVDPASASVTLDGADATASCASLADGIGCPASGLSDGTHSVQVAISDAVGNRSSKDWTFEVDTSSIGVNGQAPADGSWQTSATPEIKADFQPARSGAIDVDSISIILDGDDVSSDADRRGDGLNFTPAAAQLSQGWHHVSIAVSDDAGHAGHSEWDFGVDTVAPAIGDETPTGTTAARPAVTATLEDGGSGIDPASLSLTLDGVNDTGAATLAGGTVSFTPSENLAPGVHNVQLGVSDQAGNRQTKAWGFTVAQPAGAPPAHSAAVARQLTTVEYWESYGSPRGAGGWIISGFQAFPSTYFLPWYDSSPTSGSLSDEIVIANHGAGEATVNIFVAGENKLQKKLPEGGTEVCKLPDTTGGPVKIICPTGQPLEVTHRITSPGKVSESPATSGDSLEPVLLLPWYESRPAGQGTAALMIANAGEQEATVDVFIGDPGLAESLMGHYSIKPNAAARAELPDVSGGPVRIVATNSQPLVATLRVTGQGSFSELQATGLTRVADALTLDPAGMADPGNAPTLHVANGNGRDMHVEIRIGDELFRDPDSGDDLIAIDRHNTRSIDLGDRSDRRIEITCTDCSLGEGLVAGRL